MSLREQTLRLAASLPAGSESRGKLIRRLTARVEPSGQGWKYDGYWSDLPQLGLAVLQALGNPASVAPSYAEGDAMFTVKIVGDEAEIRFTNGGGPTYYWNRHANLVQAHKGWSVFHATGYDLKERGVVKKWLKEQFSGGKQDGSETDANEVYVINPRPKSGGTPGLIGLSFDKPSVKVPLNALYDFMSPQAVKIGDSVVGSMILPIGHAASPDDLSRL